MKDKRHIDELFKERFKDFDATPSPQVWSNIQAKMKKEKDRKVVPLWLRWSGVAAVLILLLLAGNFIFNPFDPGNDNSITTDNTESTDTTDDSNVITDNPQGDDPEIASENEIENEKSSNLQEDIVKQSGTSRDAVADENTPKIKEDINPRDPLIKDMKDDAIESIGDPKEATAVSEEKNTTSEKNIADKINAEKIIDSENNPVSEKNTGVADTETNKEKEDEVKEDIIKRDIDIIDSETPVVTATDNGNKETTDAETNKEEEKNTESEKPSLIDAINEKNEEEAIAKTKKNTPDNRWEVTPNVGPVYYDSFGSGSSIDPSFADNPQSGDVNISYGVAVSYNISERLSVRSGINSVRLSYSTGGIELADAPVGRALRSVDYGNQQTVTTAFDSGTLAMATPGSGLDDVRPKSGGGTPEISQQINYFEVPLELRYSLLDSRFGINMIGGFSTLFLGSNEISVSDGSIRNTLGEANNLNSLSFSTNIGLGFDYKISRSLRFNIEPIFKYQLNPYSDSSVGFRPYYLGVYSGLSFKF